MWPLEGVTDLHIHSGPDIRPRIVTDVEAVAAADAAGMHAILLKTHWTCTADRATLAADAADAKRVQVLGGLVLNNAVGGLNMDAVEKALIVGAREVWLPTHDSRAHREYHGQGGGLSVTDPDRPDRLSRSVAEIVDFAAEHSCIIGAGHIGVPEIFALLRFCQPKRYKVLVSHPEWYATRVDAETQREMATLGATFERCVVSTVSFADNLEPVTATQIADEIRKVGIRSSTIASDLGQAGNPTPTEGLSRFLEALHEAGLSEDEIRAVSVYNPRALLEQDHMPK